MSLPHIEAVVQKFIFDNHNDLLVIKGGWGVGKTFFWQRLIAKSRKEKRSAKPYYSYVSLFGVNSLEDLKNTIFAAREDANAVSSNRGLKQLSSAARELAKQAEQIPILREWTGGMASQAIFMLLRETLICIDDIERRGNDLDIKDVMGLASLLKEQRDCKIVFIMNDGGFTTDENDEFRRHSEKITDIELSFAPTLDDIFGFVFSAEYSYYSFIKDRCLNLNIRNIRTLHRIKRFIDDILFQYQEIEYTVAEDILRSIILYIWCLYDKDVDAPPISFIKSQKSYSFLASPESQNIDTAERVWAQRLLGYQYYGTEDIDKLLISFVETGYIDSKSFEAELEKKNKIAKTKHIKESHRKVWNLYHNSFENNGDEFIEQLLVSFTDNQSHLGIDSLDSAVSALRELGHDREAEELIHNYISLHKDTLMSIRKEYFEIMFRVKDQRIIDHMNAIWDAEKPVRTLLDVIEAIILNRGWGVDDMKMLQAVTVDELYDFFKAEKSENLYDYVSACLRFSITVNGAKQGISHKAEQALRRIALESPINRMRVSSIYGIELSHEEPIE
jgi:hypothetical protein